MFIATELNRLNLTISTVLVLYIFLFIYVFPSGKGRWREKEFTHIFNLFLDAVARSFANVTTGVAWMFSWRKKNACKATWAVNASKIRVTFWDVRDRERTKNSLRGSTVGIKFMSTIINSVASSYLTVGRHRICTYWLSGRAGRENIWLEVRVYGPSTRSARLYSVNKYFII